MKKITTAVLTVLTAGILILSLAGCTFFSPGSSAEEPGGDDPVVTPDPGEDPGEDPGKEPEEEPEGTGEPEAAPEPEAAEEAVDEADETSSIEGTVPLSPAPDAAGDAREWA